MKIVSAQAGSETMTEQETKNFLANNANNLLMRMGTIDGKGEPNVTVTGFYFDESSEKILIVTQNDSKKVQHLKNRNIMSYCIDDPNPPYTGVRGKGTVKFLVDIQKNIPLAKKYLKKLTGSLDNHFAKWLMNEIEKGNSIFLEITPRYFSTWRIPVPQESGTKVTSVPNSIQYTTAERITLNQILRPCLSMTSLNRLQLQYFDL